MKVAQPTSVCRIFRMRSERVTNPLRVHAGMLMDWREMAGRPTVRGMQGEERWRSYTGVWSGGRKVGAGRLEDQWDGRTDPVRGWVIALCWMVASAAEQVVSLLVVMVLLTLCHSIYYLYTLVRRPRMILDFAITLVFNHLVLTTYYSASLPTSLFFWLVMIAGAALTVVVAEQLCVKRELSEGLNVVPFHTEAEEMEMGEMLRRD
jgi:hypothetical protein